MSDKLISQFEEGIASSGDWLLYEDANSTGAYKKTKRANVGSGSGSVGVTLTTPTLSVSVASSSSMNLSWTNVFGESSYQVQQSLNNTTWTTIATPAANSNALTVSGLSASTLYYFRVKAVGDGVNFLDSGYGTGSGTTASGAGDTTAPTVSSRTVVASDKIRIVYNENMGGASPAGHQFNIDGTAFTPISATAFNSTTVDYVVGTTMTSGSVVTHGYSLQPTGAGTRDLAGNQLAGFSGASVTNSLGGGSTWTKRAGVSMTTNVGGFWEYLPSTYSPSGAKVPVIIAWHGGGAQGTGSSTDLNALLNEGVPQQINASGFSYQSVVICPQYTGGAPSGAMIEAVIDYVLANYNVEPTKVHLTGLSFGGAILGNWAVTGTITKVASISVLCSYFDVNSTAVTRLKASGMPIRLYHGDADSVAPVTNSRNWFNSLNAATAIVPATEKYEIVGAEHNIWTDVYPSSAIFGGKNWAQWHMEQQRSSYDSDAVSFFTAASITNTTQKDAVNAFVVAAKANGYWSKLRRVFPFVGGDATKHAFDLKTATSVISWTGSLIHSATGVEANVVTPPSTSTGWGDTGFNINSLTNNSIGLHMYRRDNADHGNQYQIGAFTGTQAYFLQTRNSNQFKAGIGEDTTYSTVSNSDARGFYSAVRTANNVFKVFKNGSQVGSTITVTNPATLPSGNVYLFGLNNIGTGIALVCPTDAAFAAISDGLSDTEVANMYTDVQAMQTALSRAV